MDILVKNSGCIRNRNNSILGTTSVVVRMAGYVKYGRSIWNQRWILEKWRPCSWWPPWLHLHCEKYKKAIDRKRTLYCILRKGSIKAKITTGAKKSEIQKREHNRRVISKFIKKSMYFMCGKNGLWNTIFMI